MVLLGDGCSYGPLQLLYWAAVELFDLEGLENSDRLLVLPVVCSIRFAETLNSLGECCYSVDRTAVEVLVEVV